MKIQIPKLSLVALIGASGAGKSTFASRHFHPFEILSSDYFRGLVSNDENNQSATNDAFDALHYLASIRLQRGNLTVIDATNVQREARRPIVSLARKHHCLPVAIVLDLPETVCLERNRNRENRDFGSHVIRQQRSQLRRSIKGLKKEGFRQIYVLRSATDVDAAVVERVPLWNDKRELKGPFDIIGDVHGCCDELEELLGELGYVQQSVLGTQTDKFDRSMSTHRLMGHSVYAHPEGRTVVFLGDLVDRGPRVLDTLRIAKTMIDFGSAICVPGNHESKLLRKLRGRNVQLTHGLKESWNEIENLPEEIRGPFCNELADFLDALVSHYVFDEGNLVVAHAGLKEEYQGRGSGTVREFCLYGETTGETDEFGFPERVNWAADYRGRASVVYGHTPVLFPEWLNNTVCIDTGCVFGGSLTALRYPERDFVSVDAKRTYCSSGGRLPNRESRSELTQQQKNDDVLDARDVIGKRSVSTRVLHNVTIREENASAALEVMSRFAVNPKWLIYLPPTMSPCETSNEDGFLEHPGEAFSYFKSQGVQQVVCQRKHMGSRAIVVVCQDADAARSRFGIITGEAGMVYTRTGRRFFNDSRIESDLLNRLRSALSQSNFWKEANSRWVCLDCELMPWSAKAQELLRWQYAAVGAAGRAATTAALDALRLSESRLDGEEKSRSANMLGQMEAKSSSIAAFTNAYRHYCWTVDSVDDLQLAPFHLLASESQTYFDRDHLWHMEKLTQICQAAPSLLLATDYRVVDTDNPSSTQKGIEWWHDMTSLGGEGMVVKPLDWIVRGKKGIVQPAVKVRGQEYLRIIYGPDYDSKQNLSRLRQRKLGRKRSLALREFSLGIESLERFVEHEPLRRVHECVFGVLALESEPVDPRL